MSRILRPREVSRGTATYSSSQCFQWRREPSESSQRGSAEEPPRGETSSYDFFFDGLVDMLWDIAPLSFFVSLLS